MLFVYQPVLFVRSISNDLSTESPFTSTCPICLLTLSNILTEQEYAEATDHYVGDEKELGLRRLPCGQGGSGAGAGGEEGKVKGGHVICGKCARKWLRLVSRLLKPWLESSFDMLLVFKRHCYSIFCS